MKFPPVIVGATALLALAVAGAVWWETRSGPPPEESESASADIPLPIPPLPPRIAQGEEYDHCLSLLASDPDDASDFAEAWSQKGGGDGATHCQALAKVALGDPEDGAQMMETLAANAKGVASARAVMLRQAGEAWMMANDPARALAAAGQALALAPDDADALVDHAAAALQLDRNKEAVADLTRALEIDPQRTDAMIARASALRQLGRLDEAQADVDRALAMDAENPEALLERGILKQRRNDRAGARTDWERAIALAPDTPTADLAQQNLALLEAGPERR